MDSPRELAAKVRAEVRSARIALDYPAFSFEDADAIATELERGADAIEALTRERFEAAGFQCFPNVCSTCFHKGGDHDIWNRCLACDCRCFTSMREDEQWAYAFKTLLAASAVEGSNQSCNSSRVFSRPSKNQRCT